jgi:hypothetical protein
LEVLQAAASAVSKLQFFNIDQFDAHATVLEFKAAHGLIEDIYKSPDLNVSRALYMTEFLSVEPFRSSERNGLRSRKT